MHMDARQPPTDPNPVKNELARVAIRQVMTAPVRELEDRENARAAAALMARHHINHLVVVDGDRRVVGVLSDRDIRAAQPSVLLVTDRDQRDKALSVVRVRDIMAKSPLTVDSHTSVQDAVRLMVKYRVGCLPVVDGHRRPVGILTGIDMLQALLTLVEGA